MGRGSEWEFALLSPLGCSLSRGLGRFKVKIGVTFAQLDSIQRPSAPIESQYTRLESAAKLASVIGRSTVSQKCLSDKWAGIDPLTPWWRYVVCRGTFSSSTFSSPGLRNFIWLRTPIGLRRLSRCAVKAFKGSSSSREDQLRSMSSDVESHDFGTPEITEMSLELGLESAEELADVALSSEGARRSSCSVHFSKCPRIFQNVPATVCTSVFELPKVTSWFVQRPSARSIVPSVSDVSSDTVHEHQPPFKTMRTTVERLKDRKVYYKTTTKRGKRWLFETEKSNINTHGYNSKAMGS